MIRQIPIPDRRAVARTRMANAPGKINVSGVERLCDVRDLSPIGIGLQARDLPPPGQRIWVEVQGLAQSAAVVVWRDPGQCGLRFEVRQKLTAVITGRDQTASAAVQP